ALERFDAAAASAPMPGLAAGAGVGAVLGHVGTAAAANVGLQGLSEAERASLRAEAERIGHEIGTRVATFIRREGWAR
uniref:hypothetical protein n=1 Tax=Falsiroseomonas oryzae TaxID=2766473 RepID=UPI0022EA9814